MALHLALCIEALYMEAPHEALHDSSAYGGSVYNGSTIEALYSTRCFKLLVLANSPTII